MKTYTFNELSKDAQKRAVDNLRHVNVNNLYWSESIFEDFVHGVQENYGVEISTEDISFSGFCNQGDGASFTATLDDQEISSLLDKFGVSFRYGLKKTFIGCVYKCEIQRDTSMYYHAGTVSPVIELNITWLGPHLQAYIEKKSDEFYSKLEEWKNELCHELYKRLDDEYTYLTSNESVIENIFNNNYEFLKGGEFYA